MNEPQIPKTSEGEESEETKKKNPIKTAVEAAEFLKKENDRRERLLLEEKELQARRELGGNSNAGNTPQKKKELTDAEYTSAFERGEVNPLN